MLAVQGCACLASFCTRVLQVVPPSATKTSTGRVLELWAEVLQCGDVDGLPQTEGADTEARAHTAGGRLTWCRQTKLGQQLQRQQLVRPPCRLLSRRAIHLTAPRSFRASGAALQPLQIRAAQPSHAADHVTAVSPPRLGMPSTLQLGSRCFRRPAPLVGALPIGPPPVAARAVGDGAALGAASGGAAAVGAAAARTTRLLFCLRRRRARPGRCKGGPPRVCLWRRLGGGWPAGGCGAADGGSRGHGGG